MSLLIAVPAAVASATAYGVATAVQSGAAHTGAVQVNGRRLLGLLRDPWWLASIGGDALGLVLQVLALATGPVALVQPLQVLALVVALPIRARFGGQRPTQRDLMACAVLGLGLVVFFVLLGNPGDSRALSSHAVLATCAVALAGSALLILAVGGKQPILRATVFGAISGAMFAVVAVLINSAVQVWNEQGIGAFGRAAGLVPLVAVLAIGTVSMGLVQLGFQIGELGASFPANLATDAFLAVLLGGVLLGERVPVSALLLLGYLACFAAVVWGVIRLANPSWENASR